MALPGFMEYMFYGNEQRDLNENGFFHKKTFEHSESFVSDSQMVDGADSNDDSY